LIAGLPWESWLLLLGSVGIPLAIVITYVRVHRNEREARLGGDLTGGEERPTEGGAGPTGGGEGSNP
jgi:hypothetical protein